MRPRELTGLWTDLPLVGRGSPSPIRGWYLALGPAGAFLGVCEPNAPPWIRHGHLDPTGAWEWSAAWTVPPRPDAPAGWADEGISVDSVWIDIDRLDPMRLAINRTEYQGGSHGVVVGRWGEAFDEIESPTDSDIRFGQPLVLRGDELWSHDTNELWSFRRHGDTWHRASTVCAPNLPEGVTELGWAGEVSADGGRVYLEAWSCVAVFERVTARRGEQDAFRWARTIPCHGRVAGLAQTREGLVVVDHADDSGLRVGLYDRELRTLSRKSVQESSTVTPVAIAGDRVVLHARDVLLVLDLHTGAVTHHLMLPPSLVVPRGRMLPGTMHVDGDRVVVATDEALGVYVLT